MSEDDDWFERALRDSEDDSTAGEADDESGDSLESGADDGPAGADGTTPEDDGAAGDDVGAERGGAETEPPGEADDDNLFDDDFETAFGGGGMGGGTMDGDAMGGAMGGDAMPSDSDSPFAGGAEFGGGGAGGEFGLGSEEFAEEEFESELDRIDLGIDGLDDMVRGGVPERSLMTVIGSAGTGKTTFGLQFLNHGLENGQRSIYISLEESRERILDSASEKGWDFDAHVDAGDLAIVDIDPIEMANSLSSIRSDLPNLVADFGAERLVLDSVSLLELMYEDRAKRRNEVYEFTRTLKESGVTTLLTSEADDDNPYASRHGIVEYLTDAVFIMRYVRPSDFRETRLAIEIQKIRDANHSREMKPYEITDEGLNVYRQANIF